MIVAEMIKSIRFILYYQFPIIQVNVFGHCVQVGFQRTNLSTQQKNAIGKLNLSLETSPCMSPNVCCT